MLGVAYHQSESSLGLTLYDLDCLMCTTSLKCGR